MLIMLADDDSDDRSLFTDAFQKVKTIATSLQIFEDGVELLENLEKVEELPHIIFLDLNMPKKSGIECLREIRQNHRFDSVSIAIYSTSNRARDVEETFSLGANVYIHKPSNFDELKRVLKYVLKMNWQFHLAGMNKETFFLNV
ncbi:MAG: response regulator [Flavobacterium sp.]|nr:MAG: response regulator [Flavobacterium sp.]